MTARKAKRGDSPSGGSLRVLGYVRVSTEEQATSGAGLGAQRRAITEACKARGWELLEIREDAGFSAKDLDRPGISSALAELDAGQADALVVAKQDRLTRKLRDFADLMERARRKGWGLVALDIDVDTTTPAGEMLANTMAVFAQFERRLIGQRTKDALAIKKAQGVRLGRPRTLPDGVVTRIVSERAAGRSTPAIADGLNTDGVPTAQGGAKWYPSTVSKVLAGQSA